ncbi:MAG TPA: 2-oxoacid:acceptor oxidoreductase family protein [Acidimicrobiales bacterium]|nr:2-oxoacid:acceptor oxidoreductase family protein [Acidimicrobiales bacterium]
MFQVRIHGRGGQGVVTAAEMLSVAAFLHGRHSQAFPSFGSERMGAPVVAYCRIDTVPIRTHDPVSEVDCLVVQDPTLLHEVDVFSGLHYDSYLLINSERTFAQLGVEDIARGRRVERMLTVPATDLARQYIGRPVPNTALLGGLAALTDVVPLTAVLAAIRRRFKGELADANAMAASAAAAYVRAEREAARHA